MTEIDDLSALRIEREPLNTGGGRWVKWVVVVLFLAAAGGGAWYWLNRERPLEVEVATVSERAAGTQASVLTGKGYVQGVAPADYENKPVAGTTVYFRTGDAADQNRVDAERLATKYLKDVDASVKALNDTLVPGIPSKVDLIVVLGEDYADAHPVA